MDYPSVETHTQTHLDHESASGELRRNQIRRGIERRCGDSREVCSDGDEVVTERIGRLQTVEADEGTRALLNVGPEMAAPGPT